MATKVTALRSDTWTDLGATPCFLQMQGANGITFVIEAAVPADPARLGHMLTWDGDRAADIGLAGQNVYARALKAAGAAIVVSR